MAIRETCPFFGPRRSTAGRHVDIQRHCPRQDRWALVGPLTIRHTHDHAIASLPVRAHLTVGPPGPCRLQWRTSCCRWRRNEQRWRSALALLARTAFPLTWPMWSCMPSNDLACGLPVRGTPCLVATKRARGSQSFLHLARVTHGQSFAFI